MTALAPSVMIERFVSSPALAAGGCVGQVAVAIGLTVSEWRELELLARAQKTGQAMARRARIVLAAAAGLENKAICVEVGADANTAGKWR